MIDPPPAFWMKGIAACEARIEAIMSTAMPAAQPSSSSFDPKPEALLTSTSIPPSAVAAPAT
ncbi:hypothetical protein D3C83_51610 [compost metagenome]